MDGDYQLVEVHKEIITKLQEQVDVFTDPADRVKYTQFIEGCFTLADTVEMLKNLIDVVPKISEIQVDRPSTAALSSSAIGFTESEIGAALLISSWVAILAGFRFIGPLYITLSYWAGSWAEIWCVC